MEDITLEKIELVKDKTGSTYKDAKAALEMTGGNEVDAIIMLEDAVNSENDDNIIASIKEKLKEILKAGSVVKVSVKKGEDTILNVPVIAGAIFVMIAPIISLVSSLIAVGTKCRIEIVKEDGSTINISDKAEVYVDKAKEKAPVVIETIKEKTPEIIDVVKEKAPEYYETTKEKVKEAYDTVTESEAYLIAKEKAYDTYENVKVKGTEMMDKLRSKEPKEDEDDDKKDEA